MDRQQVYKKYNINSEKQKFLVNVPLKKIIYYENKTRKKVKGYFDEIFPPETEKFCINKPVEIRTRVYTNDWYEVYIENVKGKHFKDAYGRPDWIPWKNFN